MENAGTSCIFDGNGITPARFLQNKNRMASISISRLKKAQKNYLKNIHHYRFGSLFQLVYELFDNHEHGHKELFGIEQLLEETGYNNLKDIPATEAARIKKLIRSKLPEWERQEDAEYLGYKLMAAMHAGMVTVIVDDKVIHDPEQPISITPESLVSFINCGKLNSITFSTF